MGFNEALSYLVKTSPVWVKLADTSENSFEIEAELSSDAKTKLKLTVYTNNGIVNVREKLPGTALPKFCPERHINLDSSLCIGLSAGAGINSPRTADEWWGKLRTHLGCQQFANKYRKWKLFHALSHGSSAEQQRQMEELANSLGWNDEIELGIFRRKGWIAQDIPDSCEALRRWFRDQENCPRKCTGSCVSTKQKSACDSGSPIEPYTNAKDCPTERSFESFYFLNKSAVSSKIVPWKQWMPTIVVTQWIIAQ